MPWPQLPVATGIAGRACPMWHLSLVSATDKCVTLSFSDRPVTDGPSLVTRPAFGPGTGGQHVPFATLGQACWLSAVSPPHGTGAACGGDTSPPAPMWPRALPGCPVLAWAAALHLVPNSQTRGRAGAPTASLQILIWGVFKIKPLPSRNAGA